MPDSRFKLSLVFSSVRGFEGFTQWLGGGNCFLVAKERDANFEHLLLLLIERRDCESNSI